MNKKYIIAGIVLIAVLAGSIFTVKVMRKKAEPVAEKTPFAKVIGREDAPVKIMEFSDFQCPACRHGQIAIKKAFTDYADQIQVTFYHYPLAGHPYSPPAHQASECANRLGAFWPYMDRVFRDQAIWSKLGTQPLNTFLGYAKELNINVEEFVACLSKQEVWESVLEDKKLGDSMDVKATPTFFVNGKRAVGAQALAEEMSLELTRVTGKEVRIQLDVPEAHAHEKTQAAPPPLPQIQPSQGETPNAG